MENKTLYTIIVHSENLAGILNQVTAVFTRRAVEHREPECFGIVYQGRT